MTVGALAAAAAGNSSQSSGSSQNPQASGSTADPLTQKNTFLQLLVAQIRNQDPLKPTDGVEFLSQLAQFSSLEQSMQIKNEITSVRDAIDQLTQTVKDANTSGATKP